jgi:hypothetical protein
MQKETLISIEHGIWYYFTVDLSFTGFASFEFVRFIDVNSDRKAAIVRFLDKDYFATKDLLLLPYSKKDDFFFAKPDEMLSVWTFDASAIGGVEAIDLRSDWPKNILDKAAITPSLMTAQQWTKNR